MCAKHAANWYAPCFFATIYQMVFHVTFVARDRKQDAGPAEREGGGAYPARSGVEGKTRHDGTRLFNTQISH